MSQRAVLAAGAVAAAAAAQEPRWTRAEDERLLGAFLSQVKERGRGFRWGGSGPKVKLPVEARDAQSHDRRVRWLRANRATHASVTYALCEAEEQHLLRRVRSEAGAGGGPGLACLLWWGTGVGSRWLVLPCPR